LRGFLNGDWCYVGVVIEDSQGNTLDSLWGVETFKGHHEAFAREMVAACWATKREAWRKALHEARERKYWASRDVETI
jgi:endonuclease YncB( thermonuclease family)